MFDTTCNSLFYCVRSVNCITALICMLKIIHQMACFEDIVGLRNILWETEDTILQFKDYFNNGFKFQILVERLMYCKYYMHEMTIFFEL